MSKSFREGDIVEIPLPSGRVAIGWIVYTSGYFKNLIGVLACGCKGIDIDHIDDTLNKFVPIYTSATAAKHYHWSVIGCKSISKAVSQVTTRIVGGEVFVADTCIRLATDEDRKTLHKMLTKGMPLVYEELEQLFE